MVCIYCGFKTQVTNSRPQKRQNQVWRRRECLQCEAVFTTEEVAQYGSAWQIRDCDGKLEPFSRDRLFISFYKVCGHRTTALGDADGLTDTVIKKLAGQTADGIINRATIVQTAQVALNRFDRLASLQYATSHK